MARKRTTTNDDTDAPVYDASRTTPPRGRASRATRQLVRHPLDDTDERTAPTPATRRIALADLTPDADNNNDGTERGGAMLEHSLRQLGAGRSIVIDKHGRVIGGNKTLEAAVSIGLLDVVVVPSDGRTLVAVQRTDLDLEHDVSARELAIADNRTSQVGLSWNADNLQLAQAQGVDLSPYFSDKELAKTFKADTLANPIDTATDASAVMHCCPACGHKWTARDLHADGGE